MGLLAAYDSATVLSPEVKCFISAATVNVTRPLTIVFREQFPGYSTQNTVSEILNTGYRNLIQYSDNRTLTVYSSLFSDVLRSNVGTGLGTNWK